MKCSKRVKKKLHKLNFKSEAFCKVEFSSSYQASYYALFNNFYLICVKRHITVAASKL